MADEIKGETKVETTDVSAKADPKPEAPKSETDAPAAKADAPKAAKEKAVAELLTPAQVSYENLDVDPVDAEWDMLPVQKRHYADGEPAF